MAIYKTVAALLLVILVVAIPAPAHLTAGAAGVSPLPAAVPTAQVLRLVAAAAHIKSLPPDLTPTLADAARDNGDSPANTQTGCLGEQASVPACVWGDRTGAHTLVTHHLYLCAVPWVTSAYSS